MPLPGCRSRRRRLLVLGSAALLAACAAPRQAALPLPATGLAVSDARIGVAISTLPVVDTHFPGAGCLMCIAAASLANTALTAHARTLPAGDLLRVRDEVAILLRQKGHDVIVVAEALDIDALPELKDSTANGPKKDFSAIQRQYRLDKLLVIDIAKAGINRSYNSYIPAGAPQGMVSGAAYIINLKDQSYDWYMPVRQLRSASGAWDEPGSFPGLSNAYFQALEGARDAFIRPFY